MFNGPSPASFHLFCLFKLTLQFLQQICTCEKMSIRHWDSNPQPSEHESRPITTTPGLPPKYSLNIFVSTE